MTFFKSNLVKKHPFEVPAMMGAYRALDVKRLLLLPLLLAITPLNAEAFESRAAIKVHCSKRIKSLLPNPSSYRFDGFAVLEDKGSGYGSAYVKYAAQNRFGGTQFYGAKCTAYPKNGQTWWKVQLLQN